MVKNALLANTTTCKNVAIGSDALCSHTVNGVENTAVGHGAQKSNTEGYYNTSVGKNSLVNVTTGDNNISLGRDSGADAVRNITSGDNEIVIGNNSNGSAFIKIDWTVTSDLRDKTNIEDVPHGLNFINQITPIKYKFKNI